jgi:hypothetical protein
MTDLLEAALVYAAAGVQVFPLEPRGKDPVTKRGFYDATTNPATIRRFWRAPDRNIGIPTGALSGLWILDIDPGGDQHIHRLEAEHGALPPTRAVRTARGWHLWFKYSGLIQCSAGRIAPNVDVRGDGGYCIAPPSIHETGRRYEWLTSPTATLAIAPDWLIALTRKPKPMISERAQVRLPRSSASSACSSRAYGAAALSAEAAALAATPPGTRNQALNRAAFVLFQLVAGGELDDQTVTNGLLDACRSNGLVNDDGLPSVEKTIDSGATAGLRYPRSRPGRLR